MRPVAEMPQVNADQPDEGSPLVGSPTSPLNEEELEVSEAARVSEWAIVTDGYQSWSQICKLVHSRATELPFEHRDLYRIWLLTRPVGPDDHELLVEDLPLAVCNSRGPLAEGIHIPYPAGPHWTKLLSDKGFRERYTSQVSVEETAEEECYLAMRDLEQYLRNETPALALLCQAVFSQQATLNEVQGYLNCLLSEEIEDQGMQAYAARKLRRKPTKVIGAGETPPPKTIVEALMGERAEEWVESIYSEFKGLEEQGVFSHGWTLEDLQNEGIRGKPIPCSTALTHKYKDGVLTRLKTRICIAGHRGNVTRYSLP